MRSKKLLYNSITGLVLELLMIISGLILPRLIISNYGSSTNGLISSITQFLGIIALLRAGVGGVVRAALYKPLAENDGENISSIIKASEQFMRKIAWIFAGITAIIAVMYPLLVNDEYGWSYCFSMVLILGIGTFAQYYFGVTYQLLLIADQKQYVYSIIQGCAVIVNLIVSVILIKIGLSIHLVKLVTAFAYSATPLFLWLYVRKHYNIKHDVAPDNSSINQRWDAMGHQLANYIRTSAPILLLTIFLPLKEISVYTVYTFVLQSGISTVISVVFSNTDATFGNMIAQGETASLNQSFRIVEFMLFHVCGVLFACAFVLMPSFVSVYTIGVTDVDYQRPLLLLLFTASELMYSLRTPYYSLINATGQYKQTRNAAIIESICNVGVTIALVPILGLIGAAIGSLLAMIFRTTQLMAYTSKKILLRSAAPIVKLSVICAASFFISVILTKQIVITTPSSYFHWIISAVVVFAITVLINLIFSLIFNRKLLVACLHLVKTLLRK